MDIVEIVIQDLRNCCRVCLEEPHRTQMLDMNLIYDHELQLTYYDCYEICTKENLQDCEKHECITICKHCAVELQWAYEFYRKVGQANKKLENTQNTVESGTETTIHQAEVLPNKENIKQLDEQLEQASSEEEQTAACESETIERSITNASVHNILPRQRFSGQFACQFCNKLFRNHSQMLKHKVIHLMDRPKFKCGSCERVYLTKYALKVHVDTKHKKSGSGCPVCGKVFAIAKGLEIHMRFHSGYFPFACNQCDRKFAQRSHLNVHQQVQHSSSRFLCEFSGCGKMFTSSSALRNHECIHTEMPFICDICQKGFPALYKLRLHARRQHDLQLTLEQVEAMRKFYVTRSKRVLTKINMPKQNIGANNDKLI